MPKTIDTYITAVDHAFTSVNGNPSYTLRTTDGDFVTSADASCGYAAQNYRPRFNTPPSPTHVRLTLTRAGRVTGIESL